MVTTQFAYHRAGSLSDAMALLQEFGDDARLLAGGHSLLPMMKLRLATPGHLIDISRIPSLSGIFESGTSIRIGALTIHADVAASHVPDIPAVLTEAASAIGDVQVRNRGTIGGSLAHADPGADLPAAILTTGAEVVAAGAKGERVIPAEKFFVDAFQTALAPGEIIVQVRIPASVPGTGGAYEKYPDPASSYCLLGVAANIRTVGGAIAEARVAITGICAGRAARLTAVEQALAGKPPTAATAKAAAAKAADALELFDDMRGSAAYKANLARVYTARAITRAVGSIR